MRDGEIHIGDVLRIRSWEDLEEAYGVEDDGSIYCSDHICFVANMKYLCGLNFTVTAITTDSRGFILYNSSEGVEFTKQPDPSERGWYIQ